MLVQIWSYSIPLSIYFIDFGWRHVRDLFYWSTITLCWVAGNYGFKNSKITFKLKFIVVMSVFYALFVRV